MSIEFGCGCPCHTSHWVSHVEPCCDEPPARDPCAQKIDADEECRL